MKKNLIVMHHLDIENILTHYQINENNFNKIAIDVFKFQYENCEIYRKFVDALRCDISAVDSIFKIPFLPISFFKTHRVISTSNDQVKPELEFLSSGTSGAESSRHFILKEKVYNTNLLNNFEEFYGHPSDYIFIGLLPSYIERGQSSLVHMCHELMKLSQQNDMHFFMNDYKNLHDFLSNWSYDKKPFIIGVTYALIEFATNHPMNLSQAIIMETGGMKGRKKEMSRDEVHAILKENLQASEIHSEYGMTELLSQAYSYAHGIYQSPHTQRILLRDQYDPLHIRHSGQGLVNVIDLANLYSCSFIATDDIGRVHDDGRFEILGRADFSALRGCSLMSMDS